MRDPRKIDDLKKLSVLLDTRFEGPFGVRFGLDPLLGLIPIIGDFATTGVSIYIIIRAASLGCDSATLIRMAVNVAVENLVDTVPVLGNIFDFYWRSNKRNVELLQSQLENPGNTSIESRLVLTTILACLLGVIAGCSYLGYLLLKTVFNMFLILD